MASSKRFCWASAIPRLCCRSGLVFSRSIAVWNSACASTGRPRLSRTSPSVLWYCAFSGSSWRASLSAAIPSASRFSVRLRTACSYVALAWSFRTSSSFVEVQPGRSTSAAAKRSGPRAAPSHPHPNPLPLRGRESQRDPLAPEGGEGQGEGPRRREDLLVAIHHVVGDEEQRVLVLAVGEGGESLLGAPCVVSRARLRVLDAAVALDQHADLLELARAGGVPLEHGLYPAALGRAGALERRDERQRPLALLQIGAHGLAQAHLVGDEVERVVADLEGDADVEPVAGERFDPVLGCLRQERADAAAGRDEGRRLLGDDAQVVGLARAAVALPLELQHFGLRHREGGASERLEHGRGAVLDHEGG